MVQAVDDQAFAFENDRVILPVLSNDTSPTGATITLVSLDATGTLGSVSIVSSDGPVLYEPGEAFDSLAVGESATDGFAYAAIDAAGASGTANATVTLIGINDAPVGTSDTASTDEKSAVVIDVLANDSDPDATDTLTVTALDTSVTEGEATLDAAGTITYDPAGRFTALGAGASATDTFRYTVEDGNGGSAEAAVDVVVTGVNDAPSAIALSRSLVEETAPDGTVVGTLSVSDPDAGDAASFALLDDAGGRFALAGSQVVVTDGALIDAREAASHEIVVGATDSAGESVDTSLTIRVGDVDQLADLDGTNGFALAGVAGAGDDQGDQSGRAVAGAGDIDGDGFVDLVIGAPYADPGGREAAGASYVVRGAAGAFPPELALADLNGSNGFWLDGVQPGDQSGLSVGAAGDVNGDGLPDLLVGAPGGGLPNAPADSPGQSYVLFGSAGSFPAALELADLDGVSGFRLSGVEAAEQEGMAVAGAGDINGDGLADLLVGAPTRLGDSAGESYVVFGSAGGFPAELELAALDGTTGFRLDGVAAGDRSGAAVAGGGDFNGDGLRDLLVGAPGAPHATGFSSGEAYVVFGTAAVSSASVDLASLDGTNGLRLSGIELPVPTSGNVSTGVSVAGAGDFDGDGLDDVVVGATPPQGIGAGPNASFVVFGRETQAGPTIDLEELDGTDGFRVNGSDALGYAVSGGGDINGDGLDDLIVGAPDPALAPGGGPGSTFVLYGTADGMPASLDVRDLDASRGFRIDGGAVDDVSGSAVGAAGDVNGDGFADLVIGAPLANGFAGESYVVFGGDRSGAVDQTGTEAADVLTGGAEREVLVGGLGDDVLVGNGGGDVLNGAAGDDLLRILDPAAFESAPGSRLLGGSGTDTLRLDGSGTTLDLTAVPDSRITGIEQIDLSGGGNALALALREILNIDDASNALAVLGDETDAVQGDLTGAATGTSTVDGVAFETFALGQAELLVQLGIDTSGITTEVA